MDTGKLSDAFHASLQRVIVDESPDGILVINQDDEIVSINEQFFVVWGMPKPTYSLDDLLLKPDRNNLANAISLVKDPESFARRIEELYANPDLEDVCEIQLKDGRTLKRHSSPLRSTRGEYLGRVWYFRDITEIINSRLAINASETRYQIVFQTTLDAIAITRLKDGVYIDINDAFIEKTGYRRDELIGKCALELNIWCDPKDRQLFAERIRNGEDKLLLEARFRKKSGDIFWGMFSVSRMELDGVTCVLSITRDITSRKIAQDELIGHHKQLEKLVEKRTAELVKAKESAESASVAKSAFLANMSHEIRTPLNAINGMAHLIRRGGLTPRQAEQIDKLEAAGAHLLNIINTVLELSKIEAGKVTLTQSKIQVDSILANVTSMLQGRAQHQHLRLITEADATPRNLLGDATALQQAVLNYAANAIKFTESGQVTLRVRLLEDNAEDALLRFEVEDTGIGIDDSALSKLFSAFEQADNTITRKYGGSGLGLAITKRLAELMGGSVGASSEVGKGSLFWLTVRLKKALDAASVVTPRTLESPEQILLKRFPGHRLLVVDDEPINREIAASMLEEAGQIVSLADDGCQAVELLKNQRFDVILMDMQMPNMDGLQATRLIRTMQGGRQVAIIAMTANAFEEDRMRCLEAGMNDFVAKPIEPQNLFATVLRSLEQVAATTRQ